MFNGAGKRKEKPSIRCFNICSSVPFRGKTKKRKTRKNKEGGSEGGRKRNKRKREERALTYFLPLAGQPGVLAALCSPTGPSGGGPLRAVAQILPDTTAAPQSTVDIPALNADATGGRALEVDKRTENNTNTDTV